MKSSFLPRLINDPFSDPGLFIPFLHQKRALMFDLGNISDLSPKEVLKVTHVFVTHTHMDHFVGFDTLLRIMLGRDKSLHLFGPPDFFERIEGKLAGYTWNLVGEYENHFRLVATEVWPNHTCTKSYVCRERFRARGVPLSRSFSGVLWEEPAFSVSAVLLDHRTPCLGFSLVEDISVNILKEGLDLLALPVGPWLNRFKAAIREGMDLRREFVVRWEEEVGVIRERKFPLGFLLERIARISPGRKITYITDVIGSPENREKILRFAQGSDILFIEAAFLDEDREMARRKSHLTARQAGELAKEAGARLLQVFHFSPRYRDRAEELEREAREAFGEGGLLC